jgi:hypothetical protein
MAHGFQRKRSYDPACLVGVGDYVAFRIAVDSSAGKDFEAQQAGIIR